MAAPDAVAVDVEDFTPFAVAVRRVDFACVAPAVRAAEPDDDRVDRFADGAVLLPEAAARCVGDEDDRRVTFCRVPVAGRLGAARTVVPVAVAVAVV